MHPAACWELQPQANSILGLQADIQCLVGDVHQPTNQLPWCVARLDCAGAVMNEVVGGMGATTGTTGHHHHSTDRILWRTGQVWWSDRSDRV